MVDASRSSGFRAVMLGPPGSGKGTQAKMIAERAGVPAISTGDMLRQAVAEGSELGMRVKEILDSGALVDDQTMADVIRQRLAAEDAANGFLLDGYPRTIGQAETLDAILTELGERLDVVLLIEVPEDELVRRSLARQRADDTESVIRNRQQVYRDQTAPLVDRFQALAILVAIDGHQTIDQVQGDIQAVLRERGKGDA